MQAQIIPFDNGQAGLWSFNITVDIAVPPRRRRIEFELNGPTRNICHLQAFHLRKSTRHAAITFRGKMKLEDGDFPLTLCALPGKLIEEGAVQATTEKYDALPFSVAVNETRPVE